MTSPNFLVLDEPTNDLDIMTLGVLEEYLQTFKGCLIVVSHDRYFMDKVVEHLMIFKGNGELKDFAGSYSEYIDWKHDDKSSQRTAEAKPQAVRQRTQSVRKLSFNEKREFEGLEAQIEALEQEKQTLEGELNSGTLAVDALIAKSERIAAIIEAVDQKTMRWLELGEIESGASSL